jgi:hypothetical protein
LNRKIIEEFRANGGEVGQFAGTPLLLLGSTGAKTGEVRTSPLAYLRDGDRLVVFAANGGRPTHPGWNQPKIFTRLNFPVGPGIKGGVGGSVCLGGEAGSPTRRAISDSW